MKSKIAVVTVSLAVLGFGLAACGGTTPKLSDLDKQLAISSCMEDGTTRAACECMLGGMIEIVGEDKIVEAIRLEAEGQSQSLEDIASDEQQGQLVAMAFGCLGTDDV